MTQEYCNKCKKKVEARIEKNSKDGTVEVTVSCPICGHLFSYSTYQDVKGGNQNENR
jgi:RNase P subunit RPR2